jgi:hypothetical protein
VPQPVQITPTVISLQILSVLVIPAFMMMALIIHFVYHAIILVKLVLELDPIFVPLVRLLTLDQFLVSHVLVPLDYLIILYLCVPYVTPNVSHVKILKLIVSPVILPKIEEFLPVVLVLPDFMIISLLWSFVSLVTTIALPVTSLSSVFLVTRQKLSEYFPINSVSVNLAIIKTPLILPFVSNVQIFVKLAKTKIILAFLAIQLNIG